MQMLQLESELEAIERVVRKVDLVNDSTGNNMNTPTYISGSETSALLRSVGSDSSIRQSRRTAAMVELIQQFADISATIDRLATKPLNTQVDFPSTEFPRELSDRLDKASRFDKCIYALDVKDQLLWEVMGERDQLKDMLGQEKDLCQKYASELADWVELAQGLAAQLAEAKAQKSAVVSRNEELIQLLQDNNIIYIDDDDDDDEGEVEEFEE